MDGRATVITGALYCELNINAAFVASMILQLPSSVHRSKKRSRGCASDRANLGKDNPKLSLQSSDRSHRLFA